MSLTTLREHPPGRKLFKPKRDGHGLFTPTPQEEGGQWEATDILPAPHRFSPYVVMLIGNRNAGKTLAMTAIAYQMQQRYRKFGVSYFKIASNYWMSFADYQSPYIVDDLVALPPWGRNLFLCVDEIQQAAFNRRAMKQTAVDLIGFLTMIRKRRIEVCFTTQKPTQIDPQVLNQVDFFVEVQHSFGAKLLTFHIYDWWGQFTGRRHRKRWPPQQEDVDVVRYFWHDGAVFDMFDTEQVVASSYLNEGVKADIIEQEWGGRGVEDWAAQLRMEEAQTLRFEEGKVPEKGPVTYLDTLADQFNLSPELPYAHHEGVIAPTAGIAQFAEYLKANGFTITRKGRAYYARRNNA